ncbi:IclR family transcriptional regulator [Aureimonas glaciei]|uniref:IclR family transcriptional regulator n=1 Tax=Aureimonas glaciei TaxID=1776957 RepID=A0A916Y0D2_9HYPH|nr:helix-turn-helix domain-containing protein [Aureimonas glaciei]GGD23546.1 IclR family transcriptional regulator [Aureimonas glaciei]
MDLPNPRQDTLFVASLEKGMRVLEAFGESRPEMSLQQLAAAAGLDKSATQRFANTLHRLGYLAKDPVTRRYRPAIKCLELANAYLWSEELLRVAMPKLIDLRQAIGETVNLAILDGDSIVYAVRLPNARTSFTASIIGRRIPALNTSSGRAMLSLSEPSERRRCVEEWPMRRYTAHTLMDRGAILALVDEAATKGYSIGFDEIMINEIGLSAAIRGSGRTRAAIQCSLSATHWDTARIERLIIPPLIDTINSF